MTLWLRLRQGLFFLNRKKCEALENCVLKQDEHIKELGNKLMNIDENGVILKENKAMETLNQKIIRT